MRAIEPVLSAIVWAGIALFTVGCTAAMAALYLFHPWADPQMKQLHAIAAFWGRGLARMTPAGPAEIVGMENIPQGRPVIFVANHQSYMDVPFLYFLGGQFKWMADADLFRIPFFGWAMRMAGYVPVKRGNPKSGIRSLERSRGWLARGISIFVFPEGTRSRTGQFGRFHAGAFRLALSAGVDLVPVVLVGTRQLLPRGSWVFRIGIRPQIHVLAPVKPPSGDARQVRPLAKEVRSRMESVYRRHLPRGRAPLGVQGARSVGRGV